MGIDTWTELWLKLEIMWSETDNKIEDCRIIDLEVEGTFEAIKYILRYLVAEI